MNTDSDIEETSIDAKAYSDEVKFNNEYEYMQLHVFFQRELQISDLVIYNEESIPPLPSPIKWSPVNTVPNSAAIDGNSPVIASEDVYREEDMLHSEVYFGLGVGL